MMQGAPRPAFAIEPRAAAVELMALTNVSRTSNGLSALSRDSRLNTIALARSEDMIARNYFAHEIPPDGRTVVDVIESLGVPFRAAAENIEFNNALDFATVQYASADFMNSPSHRKNVLYKSWDRMGAGVASGGDRRMYTVLFLQLPAAGATSTATAAPGPPAEPAGPVVRRERGERVVVDTARASLVGSIVNRTLRSALNL